jgi:hypothetical protein
MLFVFRAFEIGTGRWELRRDEVFVAVRSSAPSRRRWGAGTGTLRCDVSLRRRTSTPPATLRALVGRMRRSSFRTCRLGAGETPLS